MASRQAFIVASVLTLLPGCFDPSLASEPASTGEGTTDGGTGEPASITGSTPEGSGSAADTGESGCTVDGDCVDVDTCSIDACEDGSCVHAPNVDDPACVCESAADCMQLPEDSECRTRTCVDNVCGLDFTPSGTALNDTQQTAEDCQLVVCDGAGEVESIVDETDVPIDGSECTTDVCDGGVPSNVPVEAGTKCAAGECDGGGDCVGCSDPEDCGGTSTFCEVVTCEAQVCGVDTTEAGVALPEQTDGDCQQIQCDGRGNAVSVADDGDPPAEDGLDCTDDVCMDGLPVHPDLPADTACDDGSGSFCDGAGECVECTNNSQCGGGGGCMVPACVGNACTLVANTGAACEDGLFCTGGDTCNASGSCVGGPNPCDEEDGDSDCTESCNETTNSCTGNDTNGSDCGGCRTCSSGSCVYHCNAIAMCCAADDICISMGQKCP